MQDENSVYDMKLSVQDENSVNDMKLSDVTGIIDNNNQDSRRKLEIVMPPKMLKRGRPKGAETKVIGLPNRKQSCSKKKKKCSCKAIVNNECIICERCLLWCHLGCTNLKKMPKQKNGFAVNALANTGFCFYICKMRYLIFQVFLCDFVTFRP